MKLKKVLSLTSTRYIATVVVGLAIVGAAHAQVDEAMPLEETMAYELTQDAEMPVAPISTDDLNTFVGSPLIPLNPTISKMNEVVETELDKLENSKVTVPSVLFNQDEIGPLQAAIAIYESGNFINQKDNLGTGDNDNEVVDLNLEDRSLILAGISFGDGKNWVVWLNKQRLTPTRLPPQIRGINVYKNYIEIRWMDAQSKSVIPVRLRPNQRFNLDTRTFLPG